MDVEDGQYSQEEKKMAVFHEKYFERGLRKATLNELPEISKVWSLESRVSRSLSTYYIRQQDIASISSPRRL
jgi:hypothetical protein